METKFMLAALLAFVVAVVAGTVALLLGGVIANSCVTWYQISSREGASGFFVVFVALASGIAGFVVSLIASSIYAASYGSSFGKELAISLALVLVIAGITAVLCRTLADVPPTINGKELNLEVEFRFPNTLSPDKPPTASGEWQVKLASISGSTMRKSSEGTIQTSSARFEEGHWIIPTQTELFTERGGRSVTIAPRDATNVMGFTLPLPARPSKKFEQWSEWLPRQESNGQPWPANKMSCRFRVQSR